MIDNLKLKNTSNPLELLVTLRSIVEESVANSEEVNKKIKELHETLSGTQYIKVFTNLENCSLVSGIRDAEGGFLYC